MSNCALPCCGGSIGNPAAVMALATHDAPNTSERILDVMIGSLATAWIGIINYYYGSSSGSSRKTELLAQVPAVTK